MARHAATAGRSRGQSSTYLIFFLHDLLSLYKTTHVVIIACALFFIVLCLNRLILAKVVVPEVHMVEGLDLLKPQTGKSQRLLGWWCGACCGAACVMIELLNSVSVS